MSTFAEILSQIQSGLPSQEIDLGDDNATLTVVEAQQLIAAGVRFGDNDVITIQGSAASLEGLSAADIDDIANMGGASFVATDRGLDLTLAQIAALAGADITAFSRYETVTETSPDDTLVNTYTTGTQSRPDILALADGSYVVMWQSNQVGSDKNGIYTQRFDAEGNTLGSETRVNTYTGSQAFAAITKLTDGGYVIVWQSTLQDGSDTGIYAQKFDADGDPVGGEMPVNTETTGAQVWNNVTALDGGGYAVTWLNRADGTVRAQIFGADGEAVGSEIAAGTEYQENDVQATGITLLSDGKFVIIWPAEGADGMGDVRGQLFNADGSKAGGSFLVNSYTASLQHNAKVSALPGGGFVVTWVSTQQEDSQRGVYAQLFDGSGNAIGGETQVATTTDAAQTNQTVTALAGGGYVITWLSADGASTGVYSQLFDATGAKAGVETRVSTTTNGEKVQQDVVALPDGGFAVTWVSVLGGSRQIFLQIMDADGQKIGGETRVTNGGQGLEANPQISVLANGDIAVTWTAIDGSGSGIFTKHFTHNTEAASFKADADAVSALTSADVADIAELGVTTVKVTDANAVTLTKDVALSLSALTGLTIAGAASITVTGSGATLDDLSAAQVAALKTLGVTDIDVSDQAISLTMAQAEAFLTAGIDFVGGDTVTVKLTAGDLSAFTAGKIDALVQMGVDVLDLSGNAVSLAFAQADLLMDAGLRFAAGDVVTVADTASHIAGLADADIAALGAWGVSVIDLTDGAFTLTVSTLGLFRAAGIRFAANDAILIEDSAAAIKGLGAADIAALAASGVDGVRSLDGDIALSTAQVTAFGTGGVSVAAGGGSVKVVDTAANVAALGTSAIAHFQTLGITTLDVSNDQVTLSLAQVNAFRSAGVQLAGDDVVTLSLTGSQTAALTGTTIAALAAFGVTSLATGEAGVSFTAAQVAAIRTNGMSFAAGYQATLSDKADALLALTGGSLDFYAGIGLDKIKLADSAGAISSLTIANITTLSRLGVTTVDVTDGTASLSMARALSFAANGLMFDANDTVTVTATAATLRDPDITDIPALKAINVDRIDVSDNALTLSLAQAEAYVGAGVGFVAADAITVRLSYAEAKDFARATGSAFNAAGVDRIEIDMTAAELKALTYTELKSFLAAGVDGITGLTAVTFPKFTYDLVTHKMNYNPVITSNGGGATATLSIAENTRAVTTVKAGDKEKGPLTYSIVGGADKALFTIDARTGALVFKTAPDHESPRDSGKNNVYDVIVQASDGKLIDTQSLRVKVDEASSALTLTGTVVKENVATGTLVGTFSAKSLEGKALTYKLLDNADGLFKLSGAKLVTAKAIDFEKVRKDTVTIEVSDGSNTLKKVFTITVTDILETITGTAKGEVLKGGAGMDRLLGLAGNDTLEGGAGHDLLSGGAGNDRFVFKSAKELGTSKTATDTISDFSQKQKDLIDFSAIDANLMKAGDQAFSFIGTSKFSKMAGELRYEKTGADTYIYGDIDGNGRADFVLHLDTATSLKAGDFLL